MAKVETSALITDLKSKTEFCIKEAKRFLKQNEDKLNNRPNPESWSTLQCLDHLNQYGEYYLPELTTAIENSKHSTQPTFSPGFIGNMFAKAMIPHSKTTKMQSPIDKAPTLSKLDKSVLNTFLEQQKQYLEILNLSNTADLNKSKVKVTISKFVKLKLGDALRVTIYHNERHVLQAIKALKNN
jgi:hypothetical protein